MRHMRGCHAEGVNEGFNQEIESYPSTASNVKLRNNNAKTPTVSNIANRFPTHSLAPPEKAT